MSGREKKSAVPLWLCLPRMGSPRVAASEASRLQSRLRLWIRRPSATVLQMEAGCVQLSLNTYRPPQAMTLPIATTHRHTDIPTCDSPLFTGQPGVAPLDYGHSQEFFLGQAARTVAGGVRTRRGDMLLKPSLYAYACARAVRVPILERRSGPWAGGPVWHGRNRMHTFM